MAFQVTEPTSEVPDNIRPNHLIKELTKEIRYLEVREVKDHKKLPLSNQVYQSSCFTLCSHQQEEPVNGSKPVKSQGSVCGGASNGCPPTRTALERLCHARRARRAARRLQEQQGPKVLSNLDILERHTREVLRRLEVGPLEEVSIKEQSVFTHSWNSKRTSLLTDGVFNPGPIVLRQGSWEAQQSVDCISCCCRVFGRQPSAADAGQRQNHQVTPQRSSHLITNHVNRKLVAERCNDFNNS